MMRLAMSPAASGLLRALIARGGCPRDRILLISHRSVEWQSLTFIGERHHLDIRVLGPDAVDIASRVTDGLEDAEFSVPGHIVADIGGSAEPDTLGDGSVWLRLEALTVEE